MNKRTVIIAVSAFAGLLAVYMLYTSVHAKPMTKMRTQLSTWTGGKSQMVSSLKDAKSVRSQLQAIADSTLGDTAELAEHRLRTLLTELCTSAGLGEFVISCKEPKPLGNPAAHEKPKEFSREQRRLADCIVQETTITGQGSYESCIRVIALLEAQPWLARVSNISIQPNGKERASFSVIAGVTSLVLSDLALETAGENAHVHDPDPAQLSRAIARNPFVVAPVQETVVVDTGPIEQPRPKPKPYDDWVVSGVMQSSSGGEAILSNSRTGTSRTLRPGGQILGLTISAIEGGILLLTEGESGYRVALGQSLAEREAVIE